MTGNSKLCNSNMPKRVVIFSSGCVRAPLLLHLPILNRRDALSSSRTSSCCVRPRTKQSRFQSSGPTVQQSRSDEDCGHGTFGTEGSLHRPVRRGVCVCSVSVVYRQWYVGQASIARCLHLNFLIARSTTATTSAGSSSSRFAQQLPRNSRRTKYLVAALHCDRTVRPRRCGPGVQSPRRS